MAKGKKRIHLKHYRKFLQKKNHPDETIKEDEKRKSEEAILEETITAFENKYSPKKDLIKEEVENMFRDNLN